MTSGPEFPRPVKIDELGGAPRTIRVAASGEERDALARRFGLVAIDRLEGEAELRRDGAVVLAEGRVLGAATQTCAATGDALATSIDSAFALRFAPVGAPEGDEIELSETDCDTIDYSGGAIDIGEAIAEEFALALDPFPRAPDAEARLRAAGVADEAETGPFSGLKALKDRLS